MQKCKLWLSNNSTIVSDYITISDKSESANSIYYCYISASFLLVSAVANCFIKVSIIFDICSTLNFSIFIYILFDSVFFDRILDNSIDISINFVVLLSCFSITDSNINLNKSIIKIRLSDFWNTLSELL